MASAESNGPCHKAPNAVLVVRQDAVGIVSDERLDGGAGSDLVQRHDVAQEDTLELRIIAATDVRLNQDAARIDQTYIVSATAAYNATGNMDRYPGCDDGWWALAWTHTWTILTLPEATGVTGKVLAMVWKR